VPPKKASESQAPVPAPKKVEEPKNYGVIVAATKAQAENKAIRSSKDAAKPLPQI